MADWMTQELKKEHGFPEFDRIGVLTIPEGRKLSSRFVGLSHERPNGRSFVVVDDLLADPAFHLVKATFESVLWMDLDFTGFTGFVTWLVIGGRTGSLLHPMDKARDALIIDFKKGPVWPVQFAGRLADFCRGIDMPWLEPVGKIAHEFSNRVTYVTDKGRRLTWTQTDDLGGPRRLIGELVVDFGTDSSEFLGQLVRRFGLPKELLE